ncbi:MAG TPA: response regulator transcription factor [Oxalicibacterium sp.]
MHIAALEDNFDEASLISHVLTEAGHSCELFGTGASLLAALSASRFDLLVLDWRLPDMTGFDVLGKVRNELGLEVLVLFLSNHDLQEHIVAALMAGGDDYMLKPIRGAELLARVHALGRRLQPRRVDSSEPVMQVGPYRLDRLMNTVELQGRMIELKPKEFGIALVLLENMGAIVSRRTLMEKVWGRELLMTSRTLDTHISQVRRKLMIRPENGVKLSAIYTLGYRLDLV